MCPGFILNACSVSLLRTDVDAQSAAKEPLVRRGASGGDLRGPRTVEGDVTSQWEVHDFPERAICWKSVLLNLQDEHGFRRREGCPMARKMLVSACTRPPKMYSLPRPIPTPPLLLSRKRGLRSGRWGEQRRDRLWFCVLARVTARLVTSESKGQLCG